MDETKSSNPAIVLLFSGKRKSGKDFITDLLLQRIGQDTAVIIKLSAPIKKHWALSHCLDFSKLLDSSSYKEKHRQDMNMWGEKVRRDDYGYFCRNALDMYQAYSKQIWIVSDTRRRTDIKWFLENFKNVKTIRVRADDEVRRQRGWIFTEGIDDVASECDLDDFTSWNLEIVNNGNEEDLERNLSTLLEFVSS